MKITILTQPLGHNYGGLLQAYALQCYLKSIGCDVETLDRRSPGNTSTPIKTQLINVMRLLAGRIKSIPTTKKQLLVLKNLAEFRDQRLTMTKTVTSEEEIRDYARNQNIDAFIVGSDQVWRPRYSPSILNFYLDFLDDVSSPAKRISYAASFGVDVWEYQDDVTKRCKTLIKKFDAVSVREQSAMELCKSKLDTNAEWVVDPTLLLEVADYQALIDTCEINHNKDCIISYVLDSGADKRSIANIVSNSVNKKVVSIKPENKISQFRSKDINRCVYPKVEKWLQSIKDSSFVVTDSFHGTVFAIFFNRPFIAIGNSRRGMARFESLLSHFGLVNRLVENSNEVTQELIKQKIDWATVNKIREQQAEVGRAFIQKNLFNDKLND
ncbi:polysaccharide pyruvyl transferase family protein [Vreelandella sp. V005]|uniref:polysaccharide pyruvyl transferase family protein n=1 Tax=Vreelandella sp. V005 TaxID=3459608 RepID=UPI004043C0FD